MNSKKKFWLNKKGQMSGEWIALVLPIFVICILVFVIPLIIQGFGYDVPSGTSSAGVIILKAVILFAFGIIILIPAIVSFIIGDTSFVTDTRDLLVNNINSLSYINETVLLIIVITCTVSIAYSIIKLVRG